MKTRRYALALLLALTPLTITPVAHAAPSWQVMFREDFNSNLAPGAWPGAYAPKWNAYNGGVRGYSDNYLSASNGTLKMGMYDVNGKAMISGIVPAVNGAGKYSGARYGMVEWRMKVSPQGSTGLAGWSMAGMAWPDNDKNAAGYVDAGDGELDFPEGWLGPTDNQGGFFHKTRPNPLWQSCEPNINLGPWPYNTWHTYVIAWQPGGASFWRDGILVGAQTDCGVPLASMHFALELRTSGLARPKTSWGQVELDWLKFYRYVA